MPKFSLHSPLFIPTPTLRISLTHSLSFSFSLSQISFLSLNYVLNFLKGAKRQM
jgi:hypothetical protein